jgi:hypothetical protein
MEHNGMEWNIMEWSGVEWSGLERKGKERKGKTTSLLPADTCSYYVIQVGMMTMTLQ